MKEEFANSFVKIRKFRREDIEPMYRAVRASATELYPYLPWCHPDYTMRESEEWVRNREQYWDIGADYSFCITNPEDTEMWGGLGFNLIEPDNRKANLGYWVRSDLTAKGVATAAVKLALEFGFEEARFKRLEIVMSVDNGPSRRVAEKLGAVMEGRLRDRMYLHGKCKDAYLYSITEQDYLTKFCKKKKK